MRSSIRGALLAWFGAFGVSLTVFGSLESLIKLADWASWLVSNWQVIIKALWSPVFKLLNFPDNAFLRGNATFFSFMGFMAVGTRIECRSSVEAAQFWGARHAVYATMSVAVSVALMLGLLVLVPLAKDAKLIDESWYVYIIFIAIWYAFFIPIRGWPIYASVGSATAALALLILLIIGQSSELATSAALPLYWVAVIYFLGGVVPAIFAVPTRFHDRLWGALAAVATLLALSELSKLGLSLEVQRGS